MATHDFVNCYAIYISHVTTENVRVS